MVCCCGIRITKAITNVIAAATAAIGIHTLTAVDDLSSLEIDKVHSFLLIMLGLLFFGLRTLKINSDYVSRAQGNGKHSSVYFSTFSCFSAIVPNIGICSGTLKLTYLV
jgi:hypothetical protein